MNLIIDFSGKDYVVLDKDLLRGLSEKEVEIEHLKTAIFALNQRIEVIISLLSLINITYKV